MGGGSGVAAGAAAAELAALNLSGGDEAAMKAIEQRISAVRKRWKVLPCLHMQELGSLGRAAAV